TDSHYVAPTKDQVLASAVSDAAGRVKFVLAPSRLITTAGTVVTTSTIVSHDPSLRFPKGVHSTTTDVKEPRPDIYFRVKLPSGKIVDTRHLQSGMMVNFSKKRTGSIDAPLTFTLPA